MQNVHRNHRQQEERARRRRADSELGLSPVTGEPPSSSQGIDLNHASALQLADIDGMEGELAEAIVEHRTRHGHFRSWDDVGRVPGLDAEHAAILQHACRIGGPELVPSTPTASTDKFGEGHHEPLTRDEKSKSEANEGEGT